MINIRSETYTLSSFCRSVSVSVTFGRCPDHRLCRRLDARMSGRLDVIRTPILLFSGKARRGGSPWDGTFLLNISNFIIINSKFVINTIPSSNLISNFILLICFKSFKFFVEMLIFPLKFLYQSPICFFCPFSPSNFPP